MEFCNRKGRTITPVQTQFDPMWDQSGENWVEFDEGEAADIPEGVSMLFELLREKERK